MTGLRATSAHATSFKSNFRGTAHPDAEGRELPIDRAIRGEIGAAADLEARDHREVLVWVPSFGHLTSSRLEELLIGERYLMAPMVKRLQSAPGVENSKIRP
jgi:hypothetical protein